MGGRPQKAVLFLCTGNYYRSRFAECLFNSVAANMGLPWQATSRGLALERGSANIGAMASAAVEALRARGFRDHQSLARMPAAVTGEDLQHAARIIALKHAEHHPLVQERFPDWTEKIEFWHVDDDHGALRHIEREVMALVARLLGGGNRPDVPEPAPAPEPPRKPLVAKVGRETAGRKGKGVTTVFDLPLDDAEMRELAALLKQRCGTGGTVKDGRIEIQGDQRERIVAELVKLGYKVKRVGG
jgi:predicted translation initiation factor SUI1